MINIMDENDVRMGHLTRGRQLLALLNPIVEAMCAWDAQEAMSDQLELVVRSAIVRQNDALSHAVRAVEEESAHNVAALVRPAVEELITISYLATLPRADAGRFLMLKMGIDLGEALEVQNRLFKNEKDAASQIPPMDPERQASIRAEMVTLATKYGWRVRGKGAKAISHGPSMGWMAHETGRRDLYDYLYGGASRLVHFSPTELLRRCWFDSEGSLSISSQYLERWWASFALGWGSVLMAETVAVAIEVVTLDVTQSPPGDHLALLVEECRSNVPPLVTLSELNF